MQPNQKYKQNDRVHWIQATQDTLALKSGTIIGASSPPETGPVQWWIVLPEDPDPNYPYLAITVRDSALTPANRLAKLLEDFRAADDFDDQDLF